MEIKKLKNLEYLIVTIISAIPNVVLEYRKLMSFVPCLLCINSCHNQHFVVKGCYIVIEVVYPAQCRVLLTLLYHIRKKTNM